MSWPVHRQDELQNHTGKIKESAHSALHFTLTKDRGRVKVVSAIILVWVTCYESSEERECDIYSGLG